MYLQEIPDGIYTTTIVNIKYDCEGDFERCGKEWSLKYKDAQKNFEKNNGKHICRQCHLKFNNPANKEGVRDKIKQTTLEKYGTTCVLNTEKNIAERVEKMFGTEESTQQIVDKRRRTSQEKYGADHIMKTDEGKRRLKEAFQEIYGADHPMKTDEVKAKAFATNLERYGVENVMQNPEVRIKLAQSILEKYGVEHYNQLPEMREYMSKHCAEWFKESWENGGPNKGIRRPEEWNKKQSDTMAEKILKGELNPEDPRFFVTGHFESNKCKKQRAYFRSSLELMMHYILDNDPECIWYENEPFKIPYEKEAGIIRNYIPDFIVGRRGVKSLLVEIKPAFRMREQAVRLKAEVGQKYANENNLEFVVIDEKYLKHNCVPLSYLKELPNVTFVKSKE